MNRAIYAVLLVVGTIVWAIGRESHDLPTADLHADAPYYYVYLPSLLHGDLDFTDEYRETKNWYRTGPTPIGRPGNMFGVGPAVFDAPLFVVGHGLALITGERSDGFSRWETWSYTWSSLLWSLGAIWVAARLIGRRIGGQALPATVIAALAGPIAYYAVRQPGYAHPVATFFAALLVERWDASYDRPRTLRTWIVLGACLGAAALARPQLALWGVLLGAAAVDDLRRDWRSIRYVLAGAAATLLVFLPQLIVWKRLYGSWYVVPQGANFMRWDAPAWTETLFSSRNGLFPWAPAYAVFAIALIAYARRAPRLVIALVTGTILQAVVNGAAWDWWAGGSFGGRRFDSTFIAFAVGAAILLKWLLATKWAKFPALALLGALVVANLFLIDKTVATSARIKGGEAASAVLYKDVMWPFGWIAGHASRLTNLPARAAFAVKWGVDLDRYDTIVGNNVLGETYTDGSMDQTITHYGVGKLEANGVRRILIGLNRSGKVVIEPPPGIGARWNGMPVGKAPLDINRGTNELELYGPPNAAVASVLIRAIK